MLANGKRMICDVTGVSGVPLPAAQGRVRCAQGGKERRICRGQSVKHEWARHSAPHGAMNEVYAGNTNLVVKEATQCRWRPRDGRTARVRGPRARLVTHGEALEPEASDGAFLSSGSLQSSRFMITADACLQPTREGRFSKSRHVSREPMVTTLCPPPSTPFTQQHEYNSLRVHFPARRIKGPT
ncbi:hypothetical protein BJV77DRAFT_634869 [Russula vinacea]|nr:hypothetical protein BJV77DRAFT_634869 [Russula vinacea]